MNRLSIGISAIEYYLGTKTLRNEELNKENPLWDMDKATERSGVISRPIAPDGVTALDLSYQAV